VQAQALSLVPPDLAALIGDARDHSLPAVTRYVSDRSFLITYPLLVLPVLTPIGFSFYK
jgi:hypothetical protein